MSFGHSVGDFVPLVQLAHKTFRNCQKAGEEYIEIACEVRCLHSVLRILRSESKRPESKIFSQDRAATAQLIETADGCKNVLENLDYILTKNQGLKIDGRTSASKKIWQKFRFGSKLEDLGAIRAKLVTYTSTISIMIDTMHIKATARAEKKVDEGFADMSKQTSSQFERMRKEIYTIASRKRAEEKRDATISTLSLSTYAKEEKSVWRDFRKELVGKGFQSSSLERHKHLLQSYMLKLDQSGLLDKDDVSASGTLNRSSWLTKKTYMETVNPIADKPLSGHIIADHDMPSIAEDVDEDGSKKQERREGVHEGSLGAQSPEKLPSVTDNTIQKPSILLYVEESALTSLNGAPDENEPPGLSASASSSETETNDEALDNYMPTKSNQDPSASMVQSKSAGAEFDASEIGAQNVISVDTIGLEPLQKEEKLVKKRPKAFVRDEIEEEGLEIGTEPDASPKPLAASSPTVDNDFFMQSSTISSLLASSHPSPEQSKETVRIARRPKVLHIETADEILHESNLPTTLNNWGHPDREKISIDQAITIDGTSRRHRHRDGERRRISSRTRNVIESWEAMRNNSGDRGNEHLSPIRPRSLPLSPMRSSTPKIHQKSDGTIKSRHSRSRSTPISPLRPLPSEVHQSATKVRYRSSAIEIVNFASRDSISTKDRISLPRKSILKVPTKQFQEDPNPAREGVAPLKDAKKGGIPIDARWTKLSRTLVNPEALKAAKERFEATDDFVIVLRVLDREEIDEYARATQKIRTIRERKEENDRKIGMNTKQKQASEAIQHVREYLKQKKDK